MSEKTADVCPDSELIRAYKSGNLHDPNARELERHLEACGSCQALFDSLPYTTTAIEVVRKMAGLDATQSFQISGDFKAEVAAESPADDDLRFRVLRPHARGGLGEVSVAFDKELDREVALKEIQERYAHHPESRARFLAEARITGGLEHPGIVPVYGMGAYADGRPFYAMRFIRGDSLKDAIQRFFQSYAPPQSASAATAPKSVKPPSAAFESFEFRKLLQRFIAVCNAVAYAHARGVVHRDLKPANIMLGDYGETLVVDWGLAKATGKTDDSLAASQPALPASTQSLVETVQGSTFGTPGYMSPEQAAGRVDLVTPAVDIYCLGATLYHLLTGEAPHRSGDGGQLLSRIQAGDFPRPRERNAAIPAALQSICLKAMALAPADRYPTALAVASDLEHWLADDPVSAHRDSLGAKLRRWSRRHRTLLASALALVFASVFALGIGFITLRAEQSRTLLEKMKAEGAARESTRLLAGAYFREGLRNYDLGRLATSYEDFSRTLRIARDNDPEYESYLRLMFDRLTQSGKGIIPPSSAKDVPFFDTSLLVRHQQQPFEPDLSKFGQWELHITGNDVRVASSKQADEPGEVLYHPDPVHSASFSPDGAAIVTTCRDGFARIWTAADFSMVSQTECNAEKATFGPESRRILLQGSHENYLWIWEPADRDCYKLFEVSTRGYVNAAFSPDGRHVLARLFNTDGASYVNEDVVFLFDVLNPQVPVKLRHLDNVEAAQFDARSLSIATRDQSGALRRWEMHERLPRWSKPIVCLQLSEDGKLMLAIGADGIMIVDTKDGSCLKSFDVNKFSLSDMILVSIYVRPNIFMDFDKMRLFYQDGSDLLAWDFATERHVGQAMHHDGADFRTVFGRSGAVIVTCGVSDNDKQTRCRIWDAATGKQIGGAIDERWGANVAIGCVSNCVYVPKSKGNSTTVFRYDIQNGAEKAEAGRVNCSFPIYSLFLSPDESFLAAYGPDEFCIWNLSTGEVVRSGRSGIGHDFFRVAKLSNPFRADGSLVCVPLGRGNTELWNFERNTRGPVISVDQRLQSPQFSPNGKVVALASGDRVQLFDVASGVPYLIDLHVPWMAESGDSGGELAFVRFVSSESSFGGVVAPGFTSGELKSYGFATPSEFDLPVATVRQYVETFLGRVEADNGSSTLSANERRSQWNALSKLKEFDELICGSNESISFRHERRAAQAEDCEEWFAAVFHLERSGNALKAVNDGSDNLLPAIEERLERAKKKLAEEKAHWVQRLKP